MEIFFIVGCFRTARNTRALSRLAQAARADALTTRPTAWIHLSMPASDCLRHSGSPLCHDAGISSAPRRFDHPAVLRQDER